ncbi:PREDICTED: bcl-2-like protein 1 [Amphimedon queenslandica]|uniref:Bcl-2 Bcl-2 homology region 1-3 domain-containing protein n=1 Tax=Amphimedon queenslandica TaxID=400682 RepID=A0A1X7UUJ1_AMPQE|nr:PREDICTED: bcl-2-like protein 1 [Amphimedon queenslandica]|eukprot:XP_003386733.1 PREDICTED: bcl-2-like protein 1 [Amphimedon queenslandica]
MALVVNPAPVQHQYHHKNSPKRRGSPVQDDKFYEETRNLITACIESASGKEPLSVKLSEEALRIVGMVQQTLKADEIFFRKLCEELELTATNLFSKLMDVWGGMFSDGQVNIGRLLALLAFCQCVTVYCRSVGLPSIESSVPHWASIFISTTHLKDWITNRGGWDAISKELMLRTSATNSSTSSRTASNGGWLQWGVSGIALAISVFDALHNSS